MTSKKTKRYLYAFIASQPLVMFLLIVDQGLELVNVPRNIIYIALSLPWAAAAMAIIAALRELGLSVGREWVHWSLALALFYAVHFFAAQEIYIDYIAPINLIVFPALAIALSHIDLREEF